jgi:hypothetical protein
MYWSSKARLKTTLSSKWSPKTFWDWASWSSHLTLSKSASIQTKSVPRWIRSFQAPTQMKIKLLFDVLDPKLRTGKSALISLCKSWWCTRLATTCCRRQSQWWLTHTLRLKFLSQYSCSNAVLHRRSTDQKCFRSCKNNIPISSILLFIKNRRNLEDMSLSTNRKRITSTSVWTRTVKTLCISVAMPRPSCLRTAMCNRLTKRRAAKAPRNPCEFRYKTNSAGDYTLHASIHLYKASIEERSLSLLSILSKYNVAMISI